MTICLSSGIWVIMLSEKEVDCNGDLKCRMPECLSNPYSPLQRQHCKTREKLSVPSYLNHVPKSGFFYSIRAKMFESYLLTVAEQR